MRLTTSLAIALCLILRASPSFAQYVPPGLNPGDHYHLVFVTSFTSGIVTDTSVPPPAYPSFGGIAAADYIIEDTAAAVGLVPNWNFTDVTWKAILSNQSVDAKDHINVQGPVYNTRGELVATGAADLWDGSLAHAIQYDEGGGDIGSDFQVWTGTNTLGHKTAATGGSDWNDPHNSATTGLLPQTDGFWVQNPSSPTSGTSRLYGISPLLTVPLVGDYNNDGVVDGDDYVVWRKSNGPSTDYDQWRTHYGQSISGSGSSIESESVPEPSSLALLVVFVILMLL